ncbi:MAG: hypothetical protein ACI8WW_002213 [Oceanospirillaceae bacterium]
MMRQRIRFSALLRKKPYSTPVGWNNRQHS